MSSNNRAKAVRFSEGNQDGARPPKRQRRDQEDEDDDLPGRSNLKKKKERINEDEMDDVDDWVEDEEDADNGNLPSEKERLQAKRARREKQQGQTNEEDDVNDNTRIDESTSLATEGVEIEPFHMNNERSDGTGYFDGDTYVFRKRDEDEEPDAWLESLNDDDNKTGNVRSSQAEENISDSERSSDAKMEASSSTSRSKEEWYAIMIPLMTDQETIMQAVVRYGALLKRQPLKRSNKKKKGNGNAITQEYAAPPSSDDKSKSESFKLAQESLNDLTEAASALLGMGDVDIYQKTKAALVRLLPKQEIQAKAPAKAPAPSSTGGSSSKVFWEYKGSQDNQIHGPYSGEQMKAWIGAGYFVGASAVQIRSIREKEKEESNVQDLLSDLMDDDDEDNNDAGASSKEPEYVRGEWQSSDKVDYDAP